MDSTESGKHTGTSQLGMVKKGTRTRRNGVAMVVDITVNEKPSLSAYEEQRAVNIARNQAVLASLNIPKLIQKKTKTPPKRRVSRELKEPQRTSSRVRRLEVNTYTPVTREEERESRVEDERGARAEDGRWKGERFGEVPGFEEGHVFGEVNLTSLQL